MIKIITGFSHCGGSTVALAELCNLFNDNSMPCQFYGPHDWVKCKLKSNSYQPLISSNVNSNDTVIYHYLPLTARPSCKKLILSCHEKGLIDISAHYKFYDTIHFVAKSQLDYHKTNGTIIPNIITKYSKNKKRTTNLVAGIIGSFDKNKRVPWSILRASCYPSVTEIQLWGNCSEEDKFTLEKLNLSNFPNVFGEPLKIIFKGVSDNMRKVYDGLDIVFSSSVSECLPMIQAECHLAGVKFMGLPESSVDISEYIFDNNIILEKWKELIL